MHTKEKNTELIFGIHPILELLRAKRRKIVVIYTTKPTPKSWGLIEKLLPKGTQIQCVDREVLHKMAGSTDHQGIVAWTTPFEVRKKFFEPTKHPFLLMLDGIQDPRNLGAILRSAYCTGVSGIILVQKGASPLTAVALKSSAGLAEHLEIFVAPSAKHAVQLVRQAGYTLYLAVLSPKAEQAQKITYQQPLCLVIGSEGAGVSSDIMSLGHHIQLPQREQDISYNASVAAGILLFLIVTQRNFI